MRRSKILEILYHPAFLSLVIWCALILTVPLSFSRYRIKILNEEFLPPNTYIIFSDLDSDGSSERLTIDLCDREQTKVIVYKDNKVADQYNVAYHPSNVQSVSFYDYNGDSRKEMYIFTMSDTALFLNVLDPLGLRPMLVNNRIIDRWKKTSRSIDRPNFVPVGLTENPGSKVKDLVFCVSTGFSLQPRNLYRYKIDGDSLIKSPESHATIDNCIIVKQNDPSEDLFLLSTQATGNTDSTVSYSDAYSWFMVLDSGLDFAFNPLIVGNYPSRLIAIPFRSGKKEAYLFLHDYFGMDSTMSMFYLTDERGIVTTRHVVDDYEHSFGYLFTDESAGGKAFYFLKDHSALVERLDKDFNTLGTYELPPLANSKPLAYLDADMDGTEEYFFLGRGTNSLIISQSDFISAIDFPLDTEGTNFQISQVLDPRGKPCVYIQLERHSWLIRYDRNPLFYVKWPLYLVLYMIIFLFISLIYKIQKYRIELKKATERELASLQMKAIRNQVEPHFTLNVLNSIGGLYLTEENRQQADYIFGRYASLIRQTVITSDKIIISLEDELGFIKNYTDIERFRAGNSFDYTVDIDPAIDTAMRIPRMLVFTFAENSVKHGLRKMTEGGLMEIRVRQDAGIVSITVEDNGPGLVKDGVSPEGTGKGLKIVNELTDLFYRLEKVRITFSIEDRKGHDPSLTGTKVTISIPLKGG